MEFLACAGMPQSCRDGADHKQLSLERYVADGFGIDLPRPRMRPIHGGAVDLRQSKSAFEPETVEDPARGPRSLLATRC
jgi:hypothetical protein